MSARRLLLPLVVVVWLSAPALSLAGEVTLCRGVEQGSIPVGPTDRFPGGTKEVYVVFTLDEDEPFQKLTSRWIAVDVGDAAPPNFHIASADLELRGEKTGNFNYTQPRPMPDGRYRLEILADGKPWKTAEFTVGAAPATAPTTAPATAPADE